MQKALNPEVFTANSEATRTRTGHNNADLMGYLNTAMSDAGCYR